MAQIVIGLCGEKCSGKTTFAKVLLELLASFHVKAEKVSTGDFVRDAMKSLNAKLPLGWDLQSRAAQQAMAEWMDSICPGIIAERTKERAEDSRAQVVLYDSVRWDADVDALEEFDHSVLVYITAPAALRHARAMAGAEKSDEAKISFEDFLQAEEKETERHISRIGEEADFKVENYHADPERIRLAALEFFHNEIGPLLAQSGR
jgi:dephospho-CoA kinase